MKEIKGTRYYWIDWMKVIAMYFVICDHLSAPCVRTFLLTDTLAFFTISGFLFKKDENGVFWRKTLWNLVIPTLIFFLIAPLTKVLALTYHAVFDHVAVGSANLITLAQSTLYAAAGFHSFRGVLALGPLWFVYTLIICRIIMHLLLSIKKNSTLVIILTCIAFLAAAYALRFTPYDEKDAPNAIVDALLGFPFLCIGFGLKKFKSEIANISALHTILCSVVAAVAFLLCWKFNGSVFVYRCDFGNSILLFLLGGISGTVLIFALSRFLDFVFKKKEIVSLLGGGTLVILGLHSTVIFAFRHIPFAFEGYLTLLEALIILLLFIPINFLVRKYCPLLWGKYRPREQKR